MVRVSLDVLHNLDSGLDLESPSRSRLRSRMGSRYLRYHHEQELFLFRQLLERLLPLNLALKRAVLANHLMQARARPLPASTSLMEYSALSCSACRWSLRPSPRIQTCSAAVEKSTEQIAHALGDPRSPHTSHSPSGREGRNWGTVMRLSALCGVVARRFHGSEPSQNRV